MPAEVLSGLKLSHPLAALDEGYGFDVPMLAGDHVTDDAGTGFVHTAPGHGADDYLVWLKSGRSLDSIPDTVDPDGAYYPHVPLFAGLKVLETEGKKAGKFGDADDAGAFVAMFCSAFANYVTGQSLTIDGGSSTSLF